MGNSGGGLGDVRNVKGLSKRGKKREKTHGHGQQSIDCRGVEVEEGIVRINSNGKIK